MTGPTGLIFAMRVSYKTTAGAATAGTEALFNEAQLIILVTSGTDARLAKPWPSGLAGVTDTDTDSNIDRLWRTTLLLLVCAMSTVQAEALG